MATRKATIAILGTLLAGGALAVALLPSSRLICVIEQGEIKTVAEGLEAYKQKHGVYPEISNFASMVGADSPLVTQDFIPVRMGTTDRWGRPFNGRSSRSGFRLESLPDPNNPKDSQGLVIVGGSPNQSLHSDGAASGPAGELQR